MVPVAHRDLPGSRDQRLFLATEYKRLLPRLEHVALLGVRRSSITEAARNLQAAALIRYGRGRINVVDKSGLGKKSCECYRFIRQQYADLHAELSRLLSRK